MSVVDILILAGVAVLAALVVFFMLRQRRQGGCVGCSECAKAGECPSAQKAAGEGPPTFESRAKLSVNDPYALDKPK